MANEREVNHEHRFTRLEGQVAQVGIGVDSIIVRIDKQNGTIAVHLREDAEWKQAHDLRMAREGGLRAGVLAVLGAGMTVTSLLSGLAIKLLFG